MRPNMQTRHQLLGFTFLYEFMFGHELMLEKVECPWFLLLLQLSAPLRREDVHETRKSSLPEFPLGKKVSS